MTHVLRSATILSLLFLGLTRPTQGHAILMQSTPKANQEVEGQNIPIELRFNSRVDGKRSRLSLLFPDGQHRDLVVEQSSQDSLQSQIQHVAPGLYSLRWQVLAEDGHISRGELLFRAK